MVCHEKLAYGQRFASKARFQLSKIVRQGVVGGELRPDFFFDRSRKLSRGPGVHVECVDRFSILVSPEGEVYGRHLVGSQDP